jgi:3-oxoacyl-[acyl-carrier-protein] synthase-3
MAWLRGLGCYLPSRVVDNTEMSQCVGVDPAWVLRVSGIEQRRFADAGESVASMGASAARDCLDSAGVPAGDVGLILASSGSGERRFPGPAGAIGTALGLAGTPAIDLPMASAGSLFGMALAAQLAPAYKNILVVGTEIMSRVTPLEPSNRDTAILFGDGAGACLVSGETGFAEVKDSLLATDGDFAAALRLDFDAPLHMDGRTIILQASRKVPRAISELLDRNGLKADQVGQFLMHQANLNLIAKVAQTLGVPEARFFHNVERYGNTSSASMLIAATEWWRETGQRGEAPVVFAAFGAGLNWGAVLVG